MNDNNNDNNYAGFWVRFAACIIDTVIYLALAAPALWLIYGREYFAMVEKSFVAGPADLLISFVLPVALTILFWLKKRGTPGKLVFSVHVVDAATGGTLSMKQSVIRYLGYFVSMIPLFIGFIWVAFDSKKQGWHDKMAGTVVVRRQPAQS